MDEGIHQRFESELVRHIKAEDFFELHVPFLPL
jgi:hypothetical protein